MRTVLIFIIQVSFIVTSVGQKPKQWTSGEIYHHLQKLGVLASVLYVAAHPDDENTRLISYMANEKMAETTYLSLTRGDGGQNLIGTEMDELLGVLRTQELLMARSVDNGKQMFSRANDFGFSKNAEETINIWDTEKVKADVVWAIRKTKPDIIINRFDHRTSGETHGHHTASAILALEMFDKSGDKNIFPEHLTYVETWQARRIFFNTSWWFYGSQEKFDKADKSKLLGFDIGGYYPLLGKSNTEMAAESRSKHKCQGFGSTGTRGSQMEYLELLKGDLPADKTKIFEGIDITWSRIKGGEEIKTLVSQAIKEYDFVHPEKSLDILAKIYSFIEKTEDKHWKEIKLAQCRQLIEACAGLYLEVKAGVRTATPGENISIDIEVIKRLPGDIELTKITSPYFTLDTLTNALLEDNQKVFYNKNVIIPKNKKYTTPYWLWKDGEKGTFTVDDVSLIGMPETESPAGFTFCLRIGEHTIYLPKKVIYKFNSPEEGEVYRPFSIIPPVSVNFSDPVFLFTDNSRNEIKVIVTNHAEESTGTLELPLPKGWKSEPSFYDYTLKGKGQSKEFIFQVTPPATKQEISVSPRVKTNESEYEDAIIPIEYDHIPHQLVQQKARAKCVRLQINVQTLKIGYVMGAGDVVGEYLKKLGFTVENISVEQIKPETLDDFDCIVFGIRAYNTIDALKFKQPEILDYVASGGKIVIQYNTSNSLVLKEIGPYPFKISRERVTVEDAEMRWVKPEHRLVNYPNILSPADFDGWVQERGLYFASDWDPKYETVFSCNDPGESPKEGSVIIAKYGKGEFVYTGLSFFRQFPAGVSGAFKLFVNLITPDETKP